MIEIDWLIHYKCNYRCPYCFFEGLWQEVEKRNKYLKTGNWVKAYRKLSDKYGGLKLIITGGEPFLYPDFLKMIIELNKFAHVSFDTNLSCSKEDVKTLVQEISPDNFFMGLSYHPSFADLEEFASKATVLKDNGFDIRIHYVTYPEQLEGLKVTGDYFLNKGFRFTPLPFRGNYKGKNYPAGFSEQERDHINEVIGSLKSDKDIQWASKQVVQVKSKGQMCAAGQLYIRVDNDGSVYPCSNDYSKSRDKMLLGNIFDENFKLNDSPMLCRQETCPCEFRWIVK
ncbi:MAG: radical SAM protein [Elusimicrobia bacterium]|nr:radical SAM protein [Candidatus Liberimonas magnetica]